MVVAVLVLALVADEPGIFVAQDAEMQTSARLVESPTAVDFIFVGPDYIIPRVSIDVYRNGVVDKNVDFSVGFQDQKTPCLSELLDDGKTSTCKSLGGRAILNKGIVDGQTVTTIEFPKKVISRDGLGFGFAIDLWNSKGDFGNSVAGGDYLFGGTLSLANGPNFAGQGKLPIPNEMIPAIHLYQGCISRSLKALEPLDRSKVKQLRQITADCSGSRRKALDQGVKALVAAGDSREDSTAAMTSALNQMDEGTARLIEIIENLPKGR